MRHHKLAITAVALALCARDQTAQASLTVEASGTGDLVFGTVSDIPVSYDVVFDSSTSLYTYLYSFTPISGLNVGQFTINAQYVNSVVALNALISGAPYDLNGSITAGGTFGNTYVSWTWNPYTSQSQLVGYTSYFGPTTGTASLNGDLSGPWGDNPGSGGTDVTVPSPATVPEPPSVIAAILVAVPFGVRVLRDLRQKRIAR